MGGFYMKMSNVKTSTVSKSAYNSRTKEYDETQGRTFNYSAHEDHVYHNVTLPEGCPEEWKQAEKLWNANEKFETEQNTTRHGKQFIIAIPQELTQEQTEKAINEFQDYFAKMGYASQADQHEPESRRSADEVEKNRHAHILTTARKITNGEFEQIKEKKMFANDRDANGKPIYNPEKPDAKDHKEYRQPVLDENGEQKYRERPGKGKEMLWERVRVQDNPLDRRETVEAARAEWARICNSYLSEDQKIDHRSYERQGSDKVAQVHEGVGSHKEQDDRKEYNEKVKQLNKELDRAKQEAEERIKEKGEQSHDHRQGETISGDHSRSDGVGGRTESGQGQTTSGADQRAGSPQPDDRPFRQEKSRSDAVKERLSRLADEAQQGMDGHREETFRDREQTTERSGRTDRPKEGERGSKERQQGASADYRQRVKDAEEQRHGYVRGTADGIRSEYAGAVRGYRTDANRVETDQRGIKEEQQSINREANEHIRGQGRFTQALNERVEGLRGRFAEVRTRVKDWLAKGFRGVLTRSLQRDEEQIKAQAQPKPEQPKQTTESPLSKMQMAQQMNATAEPRERSEDMSRSGANSLLEQAKAQNQAADQRERTAEKPQNDVLARFRQQKQETDQNRKEELEEVKQQQQTIHRRRGR